MVAQTSVQYNPVEYSTIEYSTGMVTQPSVFYMLSTVESQVQYSAKSTNVYPSTIHATQHDRTPLILASFRSTPNSAPVIRALLAAGANADAIDKVVGNLSRGIICALTTEGFSSI